MTVVNRVCKQVRIIYYHSLIVHYTIPNNHPYISSCKPGLWLAEISTAATYVRMVMWDDVGY